MRQFGNSAMSVIKIWFVLVCLCISFLSFAQDENYKYVFETVDLLKSPDINENSEEIFPIYNGTYDTMYFVRSYHDSNVGQAKENYNIWYTAKNSSGVWNDEKNLKELNNSHNNAVVGYGLVSNAIFLINSYTSTVIRNNAISASYEKNGKWVKPVPIDLYVDTHHKVYSFFVNRTEDIIMITMYNNLSEGHEDLFVSLKSEDGRWRDPIYLGHDINTEGYETSPFLADDKKTLFFTSNGFGGFGDGDIFMTKRLDDSWTNWSVPENLGSSVNSEKFDGYFSLYENGTYLLASNRLSQYSDIFEGKWKLVEVAEEKADDSVAFLEKAVEKETISFPENLSILFDFNSAKFSNDKYQSKLNEAVNFLKENSNVGLVIEGNTDKVGDEIYNLVLSHKRATGVANYLKSKLSDSDKNRVMIMPNGEVNATNDQEKSRVVVVKFILLNNN